MKTICVYCGKEFDNDHCDNQDQEYEEQTHVSLLHHADLELEVHKTVFGKGWSEDIKLKRLSDLLGRKVEAYELSVYDCICEIDCFSDPSEVYQYIVGDMLVNGELECKDFRQN